MITEICIDSVHSAIQAEQGGAERIELCSALSEGGITPSHGLIHSILNKVSLQVFVIIRPRGGDFFYNSSEFQVMLADIHTARELGCAGVVLGLLTEDGQVDVDRTRICVEAAGPLPVTFHRAFDLVANQPIALEHVVEAGAARILTSGGRVSALDGALQLASLQQQSAGRVCILAGGGIRQSNVRSLIEQTHVSEVHSSLSFLRSKTNSQEGDASRMYAQGTVLAPLFAEQVRAFRKEAFAASPSLSVR